MNTDDLSTNVQPTLFSLPDEKPLLGAGLTCNSCEHRQRWECNSKVFQYCGVRKGCCLSVLQALQATVRVLPKCGHNSTKI